MQTVILNYNKNENSYHRQNNLLLPLNDKTNKKEYFFEFKKTINEKNLILKDKICKSKVNFETEFAKDFQIFQENCKTKFSLFQKEMCKQKLSIRDKLRVRKEKSLSRIRNKNSLGLSISQKIDFSDISIDQDLNKENHFSTNDLNLKSDPDTHNLK